MLLVMHVQNIGAVARACNCFECGRLRVVEPACPLTTRSALNAAMGGQHLLWQTEDCGSVAEAVRDCAYSVAFSRWTGGMPLDPFGTFPTCSRSDGILIKSHGFPVQEMRLRSTSPPYQALSRPWATRAY